MKELSNEEIEKLAGMLGSKCTPASFCRLICGDLSHIGRGILEGRRVNVGGCDYQKADYWDYSAGSESYHYSLETIKEYHHGTEPIEGLHRAMLDEICNGLVTLSFKTQGQAEKFANGLVKKEVGK